MGETWKKIKTIIKIIINMALFIFMLFSVFSSMSPMLVFASAKYEYKFVFNGSEIITGVYAIKSNINISNVNLTTCTNFKYKDIDTVNDVEEAYYFDVLENYVFTGQYKTWILIMYGFASLLTLFMGFYDKRRDFIKIVKIVINIFSKLINKNDEAILDESIYNTSLTFQEKCLAFYAMLVNFLFTPATSLTMIIDFTYPCIYSRDLVVTILETAILVAIYYIPFVFVFFTIMLFLIRQKLFNIRYCITIFFIMLLALIPIFMYAVIIFFGTKLIALINTLMLINSFFHLTFIELIVSTLNNCCGRT